MISPLPEKKAWLKFCSENLKQLGSTDQQLESPWQLHGYLLTDPVLQNSYEFNSFCSIKILTLECKYYGLDPSWPIKAQCSLNTWLTAAAPRSKLSAVITEQIIRHIGLLRVLQTSYHVIAPVQVAPTWSGQLLPSDVTPGHCVIIQGVLTCSSSS